MARATAEQFQLFQRYQQARHGDGDMAAMGFYDYRAMVEDTPITTGVVEFRDASDALLGACLTDWLSDGLSAVYSFFAPEAARRSLGTWAILWLAARARALGLPYVYLGYWVPESRKMAYKARFRPSEILVGGTWRTLTDAETGAVAETLHAYRVEQLDGAGRRMPLTMLAFSVAALGMIGVPPVAGFVSKWWLGTGAALAGHPWALAVLAGSSLLNAAYFLPLLYRAWFLPPPDDGPAVPLFRREGDWGLVLPPLVTAAAALGAGLLAAFAFSPLGWARLIVERDYGL